MMFWRRKARDAHQHQWSSWAITERGRIHASEYPAFFYMGRKEPPRYVDAGSFFVQQRACQTCGFVELNRQEVDVQTRK